LNLHARISISVVLFAFAMGAWAAWNFFRASGVSGSYLGAVMVGELLVLAQGAVGAVMLLFGGRPGDLIHLLYGVLVALMWPLTYAYTQGRTERRESGIYALVAFFIFGLAIRAIMTGG
jgi:hypothetical protein